MLVTPAVVEWRLRVWDETAVGLDPGPPEVGDELDLIMGGTAELGGARPSPTFAERSLR